ncbi:polysaccharide biosynthesis tyrosine autokinase [Flavobacteriaceae bacterium]|nr:polysaccharide biosynthesis tyrosine autokinase [Flavobacteriaceae bacterium]
MNQNLDNQFSKENEPINIRAEIEKYISHWKWFVLSTVICLSIAIIYAKSKVNIFETKSSILVKEDDGASSELKAFQDMSSLGLGKKNNVYDEIEVLTSRSLSEAVVKKLNLNYELYQQQGLKRNEQFLKVPFKYKVLTGLDDFYKLDTLIDITFLDESSYEYNIEGSSNNITANFGDKISLGNNVIVLSKTDFYNHEKTNNSYQLVFMHLESTIERLKKNIVIASADQDSNIINLTLNYPVKEKAQLILNTLVDLYNERSIQDKNEVGNKTSEFITNRLATVSVELDEVDRLEEEYKIDRKITDIGFQSQVFFDSKTVNEQEIFNKTTQLNIVNYIIESIKKQDENFELLPTNVGAEESPQLSVSVSEFNKLLLERNRLLRYSSSENPMVQNLNIELKNLRSNIKLSLNNTKEQLEIALASFNRKDREFDNKITDIPQQTREYRSILRKQTIIANLYSYLLQKKEENEISVAVTVSSSKVIDRAYSMRMPSAPKKPLIALGGLVLGFIIPFGIIYLRDLLDTKFHSRKDLEGVVSAPVLGDIPLDDTEEKVIIKQGSRSSSAEAFRLLRTNLDFMLTTVQSKSKLIFVTSTTSGEGKTFVSVNTSCSLALSGKKVLLVGMDLRAPKITQYLGLPNKSGVTNYLIDSDENSLDSLIFPFPGFENLDVLSSGVVPPNPAELLLSDKIESLFSELREKYDYIVVDTAPVNLVTDTLMLSHHADMFIYVSRADYLDKRMLDVPEKLYQEKRLPNMAMLINGLDHKRAYGYGGYGYGGYGYGGYGYGDEIEKKSFFQKIFKK